jgi:hypothetical protein
MPAVDAIVTVHAVNSCPALPSLAGSFLYCSNSDNFTMPQLVPHSGHCRAHAVWLVMGHQAP